MKCIAVVLLLALANVALVQAKALDAESIESKAEATAAASKELENGAVRDKRGVLLSAAYTAPVAYSAYTAPVAYTASAYSYPYAYSAYPYYAGAYSSPYYVV